MEKQVFTSFIQLVELDKELHDLSQLIEKLNLKREELSDQISLIDQNIAVKCQSIATTRSQASSLELDTTALADKIKNLKDKRDNINNIKEHKLLEYEITELKKTRAIQENKLMALWLQADQLQEECKTSQEQSDSKKAAIIQEQEEISKKIIYYQKQYQDKVESRPLTTSKLPQELFDQYSSLHERVHNPVVSAVNNSCSACFFAINQSDIHVLQEQELVTCKGCYRLLYLA